MTTTSDRITLTVNGEAVQIEPDTTVARLIEAQGLAGQPVAVEVNREIVTKREHASHTLHKGDTVELVTLVGGG